MKLGNLMVQKIVRIETDQVCTPQSHVNAVCKKNQLTYNKALMKKLPLRPHSIGRIDMVDPADPRNGTGRSGRLDCIVWCVRK